jgi:hypothetical protein
VAMMNDTATQPELIKGVEPYYHDEEACHA